MVSLHTIYRMSDDQILQNTNLSIFQANNFFFNSHRQRSIYHRVILYFHTQQNTKSLQSKKKMSCRGFNKWTANLRSPHNYIHVTQHTVSIYISTWQFFFSPHSQFICVEFVQTYWHSIYMLKTKEFIDSSENPSIPKWR